VSLSVTILVLAGLLIWRQKRPTDCQVTLHSFSPLPAPQLSMDTYFTSASTASFTPSTFVRYGNHLLQHRVCHL